MQGCSYQWYYNGVPLPDGDSSSYAASLPGYYHLLLTSEYACSKLSDSFLLELVSPPTVTLAADRQDICAGDTVRLEAAPTDGLHYRWLPESNYYSDTGRASSIAKAIVLQSGNLWVEVTDQNGCVGSDTLAISAVPCCDIQLPTAFSPNKDGINDEFKPYLGPGKHILAFKVYSRWGNIVYQCHSDHCDSWTGVDYLGRTADVGVYMYALKYLCADGKEYMAKGEITLLR